MLRTWILHYYNPDKPGFIVSSVSFLIVESKSHHGYKMRSKRETHVLGIESSCDDTGVAIVRGDKEILSNCVNSQLKQHLSNGGIIPVLAKEYHLNNIDRVANEAFKKSGLESVKRDIDAIAVSTRPGLQFSLQIGLNYARTLAKKYSKPLIPIHHMQAHALMPLLENRSIRFPFLALLISGGHCLVAIAKRINEFHILGSSLDDAPGDILDKCARRFKLKNLGPPFDSISGGAAIELLSQREGANKFKYFNSDQFKIPMLSIPDCDLSFSGYRGGLENLMPMIDELWRSGNRENLLTELSHVCSSLQRVMLIQLVRKLHRAIMYYRMFWRYENEDAFASSTKTQHLGYGLQDICSATDSIDLVVSGGVAANEYLINGIRLACEKCYDEPNMKVYVPSRHLCSDNGLMVAWNGMLRFRHILDTNSVKTTICQATHSDIDLDESLIYDSNQMELVEAKATCPMGVDISHKLKSTKFKLNWIQHPEFKTVKP